MWVACGKKALYLFFSAYLCYTFNDSRISQLKPACALANLFNCYGQRRNMGDNPMDFKDLSYVTAIARHQSISGAAKELAVSQPTLSKFVQNLEKNLGQPLFRKYGNKFLLTYAGERYVEKSRIMLAVKRELDQELTDIIGENIGELKIAFPIMRGTYMLPYTLPMFRERYPRVKVTVHEANSNSLERMILEGTIDLAFFTLPIQSPDVSYEVISQEEVVIVMSANHPGSELGISRSDCKYPWIDICNLRNEPFILQKNDQRTRQIINKLFIEAGIEPDIILEIVNILAAVQLAVDGYGITFVGETHLGHIHTRTQPVCLSTGKPYTTTNFVAAFRRGVYLPEYAKEYIKIVKEFYYASAYPSLVNASGE